MRRVERTYAVAAELLSLMFFTDGGLPQHNFDSKLLDDSDRDKGREEDQGEKERERGNFRKGECPRIIRGRFCKQVKS